ncbi:hypothetical protein GWK47_053642 [Chionoecetes opilio]|uniref:N-acetyltransferase domain-containing protein n=1 Tax=Chionoecetes opilio TaxID=41210 RepID=A0A8J4Y0F5_CHIOP|nr:hypothetical protein GWK47_053642 [Chionoecetes opilio]
MMDADSLCYSSLKEEDGEEVVAFMAEHFFPREPLSTGLHMTYEDNKEWIHGSVQEWARSGMSVVARYPATGRLAGTLLGTILTHQQPNTYQQALNSPKTKVYIAVKTLHTVLSVLEAAVDFFARYQCVDRILELAMITVSEQMGDRGVGRRLVQVSSAPHWTWIKGTEAPTHGTLISQIFAVPWFPGRVSSGAANWAPAGHRPGHGRALAGGSSRALGYESLYTMD